MSVKGYNKTVKSFLVNKAMGLDFAPQAVLSSRGV